MKCKKLANLHVHEITVTKPLPSYVADEDIKLMSVTPTSGHVSHTSEVLSKPFRQMDAMMTSELQIRRGNKDNLGIILLIFLLKNTL